MPTTMSQQTMRVEEAKSMLLRVMRMRVRKDKTEREEKRRRRKRRRRRRRRRKKRKKGGKKKEVWKGQYQH
jgi:hypothetical protein